MAHELSPLERERQRRNHSVVTQAAWVMLAGACIYHLAGQTRLGNDCTLGPAFKPTVPGAVNEQRALRRLVLD